MFNFSFFVFYVLCFMLTVTVSPETVYNVGDGRKKSVISLIDYGVQLLPTMLNWTEFWVKFEKFFGISSMVGSCNLILNCLHINFFCIQVINFDFSAQLWFVLWKSRKSNCDWITLYVVHITVQLEGEGARENLSEVSKFVCR